MFNRMQLSGTVCKAPVRKTSPAGIAHCQFLLEHRSRQQEAGFAREAWCRIPVTLSGEASQLTHSITVGSRVFVEGFISSHQGRNGLSKLVLHAGHIELIDSGD